VKEKLLKVRGKQSF